MWLRTRRQGCALEEKGRGDQLCSGMYHSAADHELKANEPTMQVAVNKVSLNRNMSFPKAE